MSPLTDGKPSTARCGSSSPPVPHRTIVVALIRNRRGEILLCKMPEDRGVYPGQWGLPGGGIEEGETIAVTAVQELVEGDEIRPLPETY